MMNRLFFLAAALVAAPGRWDQLGNEIRQALGPSVRALHKPVDDWLGGLPMTVALGCAVGLYMVAALWVWSLRKEFIFRGAPSKRWWCDLRIWATLILLPYVSVYMWLE